MCKASEKASDNNSIKTACKTRARVLRPARVSHDPSHGYWVMKNKKGLLTDLPGCSAILFYISSLTTHSNLSGTEMVVIAIAAIAVIAVTTIIILFICSLSSRGSLQVYDRYRSQPGQVVTMWCDLQLTIQIHAQYNMPRRRLKRESGGAVCSRVLPAPVGALFLWKTSKNCPP